MAVEIAPQIREAARKLVDLLSESQPEDLLVRIAFHAGQQFSRNSGPTTLTEAVQTTVAVLAALDISGPELTDDAAEDIEDEINSRRISLKDRGLEVPKRLLQLMKDQGIALDQEWILWVYCGGLWIEKAGISASRGSKILVYAFFCGTIR